MGEGGPVGARYLAASDTIPPQRTHLVLGVHLGELVDDNAVALVQRLVQQLGSFVVAPGEADSGAVQIVVATVRRRQPDLLEDLAQLRRGKTRADDRAV